MLARIVIVVVLGTTLLSAVGGCGRDVTKRACLGGAGQNPLVTDAAMVRLDVYGANAHCADGQLVAGAGAPTLSRTYAQGQAISLDVPPGQHALVLSTFADADGMQLLGQGCTEADLSPGSQICFDLTISPAPDGGDDLSAGLCSAAPDSCPAGSYCDGTQCQPGCKSDTDCPKNDAGVGACDKTTHSCTDCNVDGDCGSAPGAACCGKHCVNTKSDPQNCNGCAMACTGANTQCCNGVCSNPSSDANNCSGCGKACSTLNASSASCGGGMCSWTCNGGFAHCGTGNTGCDTNLGGSAKKLCVAVCVAATSCCSSADCTTPPAPAACYNAGVCSGVGGSCSYGLKTGSAVCGGTCCNAIHGTCNVGSCALNCAGGFFDCNSNPSDGCETACTPAHATGGCSGGVCAVGSCNSGFYDCNGSVADGCEAPGPTTGPGCCNGTLPATLGSRMTQHNNGVGGTYWDCYGLGTPGNGATYFSQMATDAATSDAAQPGPISGGWLCGNGNNLQTSVCKTVDQTGVTGTCTCWTYSAGSTVTNTIGRAYASTGTTGDTGCFCPAGNDASWN